ncbi:TPA: DUF2325 domain-containing protein, partial [Escherichia coli]|nr:DUF2325 domain-containing protein [Escherichia coli]
PEKIDIIWKHNTERVNHVTPLPSSHYKKQDSSESGKATYTKYSELEGKRVLIIGGEDRHPDYRNAFELVGAKFEGLKGGAKHIQLESSIRKADVVVIVTCAVRTHTQEYAPYLCKEYQIPFTRVHNDGIESILQAAAYPKFPKHSQSEEEHHLDI